MTAVDPFPAIEPYEHGMLDVGDGHHLYWEASGNPGGKAALKLHGGPGSSGIPGVLIHGRLDLGGPADTAWQLAQAWPDAELHFVGTGHAGGAEMTARMIEATNRFART